jgi:hypothetical protein
MKTLSLLVSVLVALFSSLGVLGDDLVSEKLSEKILKQKIGHLPGFEQQMILDSVQVARSSSTKKVSLAQSTGYPRVLPTELPIGSLEKVIAYSTRESGDITLSIYQTEPGGSKVTFQKNFATLISFTNKVDLDLFLQSSIREMAKSAITNNAVRKDEGFNVFGYTAKYYADRDVLSQFFYISRYNAGLLQKNPDGSYDVVSDLSVYTLGLYPSVTLTLPRAKWIRTELSNGMTSDSRNGGDDFAVPDLDAQTLELRTGHAIAGPNDELHVEKIYATSVKNGVYTWNIYGPTGSLIPAAPLRIVSLNFSSGNLTLGIVGETGRMGRLMESTSCGTWIDTGTNVVVRPYGNIREVTRPMSSTNAFYQIRWLDNVIAPYTVF